MIIIYRIKYNYNSLKFVLNIFVSKFVGFQSMLESNSVGNLENSIDSGTFSVRNYLSLI